MNRTRAGGVGPRRRGAGATGSAACAAGPALAGALALAVALVWAPTWPAAAEPAPAPPGGSRQPRPAHAPHAPRLPRDEDDDAPSVNVDTVFVVTPGARLSVFNFGGSVALHTWSRNAVRMAVERSANNRVAVRREGRELKLESISAEGPPEDMAFALTVPPWIPVTVSGVNNDVTAEGLAGGLQVDTVHGDIQARHVTGAIALHSVEGVVDLADAKGRIDVGSVNDAVRVADAAGEIAADAVNGDVHLLDVDSRRVEATTVSGDVVYDSPLRPGGEYRFATHSGDIAVGLPDPPNATVSVATFSGDFASAFAIKPERTAHGKRMRFTLGDGAAKLNLESFQGSIEILKAGQRELRRRIDESRKAREEAIQKWGEWNPNRRMELKLQMDKLEREMERSASRAARLERAAARGAARAAAADSSADDDSDDQP